MAGHNVGDGIEDRAELGLRGEERQDQDLGDDEDRVDGGGGGAAQRKREACEKAAKSSGQADGHGDVGEARCSMDIPGVLLQEEHLAAEGEAAEIEEEDAGDG